MALPAVGETVTCQLDWEFRYRMMRTHTALHLLCGTIFRDFGAQVTGGQMYADRARMDFATEVFTPEWTHAVERGVNDALAADYPIKVYSLPREQAFEIPDLIRTKINLLPPEMKEIRIVEIVDVDLQADGGTHVHSTREVGGIKVTKTENKGKQNKRMEIVLLDPADTQSSEGSIDASHGREIIRRRRSQGDRGTKRSDRRDDGEERERRPRTAEEKKQAHNQAGDSSSSR